MGKEKIFKLGQKVYYMADNQIKSGIIGRIDTTESLRDGFNPETSDKNVIRKYGLISGALIPSSASTPACSLFSSVNSLLKDLKKKN